MSDKPYVFNATNLPSFEMTFSSEPANTLVTFAPLSEQKWELQIPYKESVIKGIFSQIGIQRFAAGEKAYADWYRKTVSGGWEYFGRYPITKHVVESD